MNAYKMSWDVLLKVCARELLEEDLAIARTTDTADISVSPKALRRIRRSIQNYEKESRWDSLSIIFRRIVAAILVVCSAFFGMCLSVDAVRSEIVHTVMKWYDEFVAVFYVSEEAPPSIIEKYREPTLQLSGTEKQVLVQAEDGYHIIYTIDGNMAILYQQMVISDESIDYNSEHDCVQKSVIVNGCNATVFEYNNGCKNLIWNDNEYFYVLQSFLSDIDAKTLILIAESVQ